MRFKGGELVEVEYAYLSCRAEVIEATLFSITVRIHGPVGEGCTIRTRPWKVRRLRPALIAA